MDNLEMYLDQNSCYGDLAIAIVIQACEDYLGAKKYLHTAKKDRAILPDRCRNHKSGDEIEAEHELIDAENFLKSDWYEQLCKIDSKTMLDILNKQFDDWVQGLENEDLT